MAETRMAEPTVACPSCGTAIPLTQSLAAPLLASERRAIAAREAEVAKAREGIAAEIAATAHDPYGASIRHFFERV